MKLKVIFCLRIKFQNKNLAKKENLEIASALKKNSFSLETSNDNESKVF
jgi:hypothetical protein